MTHRSDRYHDRSSSRGKRHRSRTAPSRTRSRRRYSGGRQLQDSHKSRCKPSGPMGTGKSWTGRFGHPGRRSCIRHSSGRHGSDRGKCRGSWSGHWRDTHSSGPGRSYRPRTRRLRNRHRRGCSAGHRASFLSQSRQRPVRLRQRRVQQSRSRLHRRPGRLQPASAPGVSSPNQAPKVPSMPAASVLTRCRRSATRPTSFVRASHRASSIVGVLRFSHLRPGR